MNRWLWGLFVTSAALAFGADWLSPRGDLQNSGWQRDERTLNLHTVGRLHLLWQRKLSDIPNGVTDPLILGPIITHRGIKELVFVQNRAGLVYAIDADLGQIFWSRSLDSFSAGSEGRPIQPTMKASPPAKGAESSSDSDHFSDGNRPLYALTAKGTVFPLRPSTGDDFSSPFRFLSAAVCPLRIQALESSLEAMSAAKCGDVANTLWSVPVSAAGVQAGRAAPIESELSEMPVQFHWGEKLLQVIADQTGQPRLQSDTNAGKHTLPTTGRLATWGDAESKRWVCTMTQRQLAAFQVQGGEGVIPAPITKWQISNLIDPGAPVVANGIVYFLGRAAANSPLVLRAVNALTGEPLYTSEEVGSLRASSGNLAVANGHVCFSTTENQTFCFGLPFKL